MEDYNIDYEGDNMWIEWSNKINILNKALDGYWLRNKTINQNISNANTPNYKR